MNDFEINRPEGYKRAWQVTIDADYSTQSWKIEGSLAGDKQVTTRCRAMTLKMIYGKRDIQMCCSANNEQSWQYVILKSIAERVANNIRGESKNYSSLRTLSPQSLTPTPWRSAMLFREVRKMPARVRFDRECD